MISVLPDLTQICSQVCVRMVGSEMKWLGTSRADAGKLYLKTSKPPPNPRSVRWWIRLLAVPGLVLLLLTLAIEVESVNKHWPFKTGDVVDWRALFEHAWHIIVFGVMALVFSFCVFRGKVPQWLFRLIPHSRGWR